MIESGYHMSYNRQKVFEYAKRWAYSRNPKYYNYDTVGGDCTNFISQCIFAGLGEMNYDKSNGWYYISGNNKSPSWTGVEFLYNFLISNKGAGPKGRKTTIDKLNVGDLIQLNLEGNRFGHSLIVVQSSPSLSNTLVATHTFDTFGKRVSDYNYQMYRCVHITS